MSPYFALAVLLLAGCRWARESPSLWEGSRFTEAQREQAMLRGLDFIYRSALDPDDFEEYASDYIWCFATIAASTRDRAVRKRAHFFGRELAARWRDGHPALPKSVDADEVCELAMSIDAMEVLGLRHDRLRREVEEAVPRFSAAQYLGFDPTQEPPPTKTLVLRGEEACVAAGLWPKTDPPGCPPVRSTIPDLEIWYDALITTYFGDRFGVTHGATFADLLRHKPQVLPYKSRAELGEQEYYEQIYLVTHLVYTHNDYGTKRLMPEAMPEEYAFIRQNFARVIEDNDPETYAEFVDTLKSFGHTPKTDPQMARAIEGILSAQNPDGSWGDLHADDIYDRYHPTWTAVDALRRYVYVNGPR